MDKKDETPMFITELWTRFYLVTTQFTTLAPASETGNNIFHPCATDSPENSYLCSGK